MGAILLTMDLWILGNGLFGLIIGSFLNVVVLRHGTGRGLAGRSACFSCGHRLSWYELVPVVSWLVQRGRCRACGSRVSWQYPAVEGFTACTFAAVATVSTPAAIHLLVLAAAGLLIAIAVYDLKHTIIPDSWAYAFAIVAVAISGSALVPDGTLYEWAMLAVAGPVTASPLWALWRISHGTWMGLGDAKLMLGAGWLLGPAGGLVALLGGFVLGATVSVAVLLPLPQYRRVIVSVMHAASLSGRTMPRTMNSASWNMRSEVPFGPFLIASCFLVWYMQLAGVPIYELFIL